MLYFSWVAVPLVVLGCPLQNNGKLKPLTCRVYSHTNIFLCFGQTLYSQKELDWPAQTPDLNPTENLSETASQAFSSNSV